MGRTGPRRVGAVLVLAVVTGLAAGLWTVRWEGPGSQYVPDSYQYARLAYRVSGDTDRAAAIQAAGADCRWRQHRAGSRSRAACDHLAVPHPVRRYQALFEDRVGYPVMVAALLPVWHVQAFAVATGVCATFSAVTLAWLVLLVGGTAGTAVIAALLLLVVPGSEGLVRVGSEAPALLGLLGVACALAALPAWGWRRSTVLGCAAFAWLAAVRPSSAVALGAMTCVVYLAAAAVRRQRGDAAVAAAAAAAVGVVVLVMQARHSPGLSETMQDTLTQHFRRPDVSNVTGEWLALLRRSSREFLQEQLRFGWTVAATVVALLALVLHRAVVLPVLCVIGTGVVSAVLHPVASELPRLLSPASVGVAVGTAFVLTAASGWVWRRLPGRPRAARPAPPT